MQAIAARKGSNEPFFTTAPQPREPVAGEVLCRTLQLGVCGTDREILLSENPFVPAGESHLVLGHECLGLVEQIGTGVTSLQPGDLVVPAVRRATKENSRRVDLLAVGQFVERGIWYEHGFSMPWWLDRPEHLFPVDPAIRSIAVLAEPLAVAEKGVNEAVAIQQARLGTDAWRDPLPRVLVTGLGPIGFAAVLAAGARGWPVTIYGRDDESSFRARLAAALGAQYLPASRAAFSGREVERDGFDLILECTGSDEVMMDAAQSLASCGIMVWLGSTRTPRPKTHAVERLMRDGIVRNHLHVACVNSAPRDFLDALRHLGQWFSRQPREVESLITARVAPGNALWHYRQRQPQGIKTVVMYE